MTQPTRYSQSRRAQPRDEPVQMIEVRVTEIELPPSGLMPAKTAARYIGVTTRTLEAWRRSGAGPRVTKLNARNVRYALADVKTWLEQKRRES